LCFISDRLHPDPGQALGKLALAVARRGGKAGGGVLKV